MNYADMNAQKQQAYGAPPSPQMVSGTAGMKAPAALPVAQEELYRIEERLGLVIQRLDAALAAFGLPRPAQVIAMNTPTPPNPPGVGQSILRIADAARHLESLCSELI